MTAATRSNGSCHAIISFYSLYGFYGFYSLYRVYHACRFSPLMRPSRAYNIYNVCEIFTNPDISLQRQTVETPLNPDEMAFL